MNTQNLPRYAPVVLRLAMVVVYLWFGVSQVTNPDMWTAIVPVWATEPIGIDAGLVVQMNGWFEIVAAILLALGVAVRPVSLLLSLHLAVIAANAFMMGSTLVGVRDFGLTFATLATALFGTDAWCYDPFQRRNGVASPGNMA